MIRGVRAVITDDLSAPLGRPKPARPSRKLTLAQLHLIAGVLALTLVIGTGWMFLADNPFGRQPIAAAQIQTPVNTPAQANEADIRVIRLSPADRANLPEATRIEATPVAPPPSKTITIIDGTSGKRQDVQIPVSADDMPDRATGALPEPSVSAPTPRPAAERPRPSDANARRAKSSPAKPDTP